MGRETSDERHDRLRRAGRWLKERREVAGWTQKDLADRLPGVSQHAVSAFERGAYEIEAGIARDIARVFDLSEYDTWRGLEIPLPAELATRRRAIRWALDLMTAEQAADLAEQWLPEIRARIRAAKRRASGSGGGGKPTRVTQTGGKPSSSAQEDASVI